MVLSLLFPCAPDVLAATFSVKNSQIKNDIAKYSVSISIDDSVQRFAITEKEIKEFNVISKKYNKKKTQVTVKSTVYIDRDIATIKGRVTSKYTLKGKKWKLASVVYTKTTISEFNPVGTWSGTYVAGQGDTHIAIEIPGVTADGFFINPVMTFSATPTNPTVLTGSYTLIGGYDIKTGKISFAGDTWINQPEDYEFVDFYCYIDLANKVIVGNNSLNLVRE